MNPTSLSIPWKPPRKRICFGDANKDHCIPLGVNERRKSILGVVNLDFDFPHLVIFPFHWPYAGLHFRHDHPNRVQRMNHSCLALGGLNESTTEGSVVMYGPPIRSTQ